ncbi:MAG TPA: hypothetical protein VI299_09415 [Polyangiales bacterium]
MPSAVVGTISCWNSGYRLYNELWDPPQNDILDSSLWYQRATAFMDAVGLIGATTASHATIKMAMQLKLTTGKTMLAVLKGLNRDQRKMLAEEAIKLANPGVTWRQMKMFLKAGTFPKRYSQVQINHTVRTQLKDAFGAACGTIGSAYDGLVNKGANAAKNAVSPPKVEAPYYGSYVVGIAYSFESY